MPAQVIVAGGGISGLVCAYGLRERGISVLVLEAADRVGGVIRTARHNGFLIEEGPQSFLGTEPLMETLVSLGIAGEVIPSDPRAPRFVLQRGRLRAVPMSPQALLASSLLTAGSRLRILAEPFRRTTPPAAEESVAAFVRRKFGHEILEYLVTPFVSGVYAGDPEMLSLKSAFPSLGEWERKYGSVIRGAMKSRPPKGKARPALCSFRGGMATLLETLAEKLGSAVIRRARVERIAPAESGAARRYEITYSQGSTTARETAAAIVLATPAYVSAELLHALSPRLSKKLGSIVYAPVAVVAQGYRGSQVGHPLNGFGFLIPRKENRRTLGTVWSSSLFPGRAPEGSVLLTSFAGGATDPALVDQSEEVIAEFVRRDIEGILAISGPPTAQLVRRWPKALPQYNLGHADVLEEVRKEIGKLPGIFLAGNYLEGPSVGDCTKQASSTAAAVYESLKTGAP